nr:MAG TPA: hypothetical protein [Caudoviricetes sp.]
MDSLAIGFNCIYMKERTTCSIYFFGNSGV